MISEQEMMDYLNGKMETVKRKDFLNQVNASEKTKKEFQELKAIKAGITFNSIISKVESELKESGFFEENQAKVVRLDFRKVTSIAAAALILIFAGLYMYSGVNYSNDALANSGLSLLNERLTENTLNAKGQGGELPAIEESARPVNPIISSVLNAFTAKDYELVLKQIQLGRASEQLLEVDRMHLDWMEIQVLLLLERPEEEVRLIIEEIAKNKQHYYNAQARELLNKHTSLWRKFVL